MAVSMQSLMKNIYSYVDVLQSAHGEKAASWDIKSLQRAYKWAEYCMQIYRQADGKPYRGELDKAIRKLNENAWSLGDLEINLELLKSAKDILTKVLLQNNHLTTTVYQELVELQFENDSDNFLNICSTLATEKAALEIGSMMKREMNDVKPISVLDSTTQQTNGSLIRRHVQHTLNNCNKEKRQKSEAYLNGQLSKMLDNDMGSKSVLIAICGVLDEDDHSDEARQFVADYLLETLAVNSHLERRVFSHDPELVDAVCRVDSRFTILNMQHLISLGKYFTPDCSKIPVSWRFTSHGTDSEPTFTYENFLERVKTILAMHKSSRMEIKKMIVAESRKTDFNIWKTVLKDTT